MRGGAVPLLVWGTLLLALAVLNWIWDATGVNAYVFAFAVLVIYLFGAALWLMNRDAVKTGPPHPRSEPEAIPRVSLSAAAAGLGLGVLLYGFVFGQFLIFLGGAILLLSLGGWARELIWQQRSLQSVRRRRAKP